MEEAIINVEHLRKKFGDFTAVDDISFAVGKSEVFAFLGPNGAGKSTTIKMLITLLLPTSGTAAVAGKDIINDAAEVRKAIGYVPQMISVDGTLSPRENLMLMAHLYDIPRQEVDRRITETLSFLKLQRHSHTLVKNFSGGMIRRLEIGQAIMHKPKVLFLDEPTSGLDPVAKRDVWKHLLELRQSFGTAIFFSTHDMEEAEHMSHRVAIMNAGRIVTIGSPRELKEATAKPHASLEDAFLFFTGNKMNETGDFRAIRRTRQTMKRLG